MKINGDNRTHAKLLDCVVVSICDSSVLQQNCALVNPLLSASLLPIAALSPVLLCVELLNTSVLGAHFVVLAL